MKCLLLLLLLLILVSHYKIKGALEWTVIGKVTDYGQHVTLFCNVSNCCPKDSGWDRWTPVQRTLYIDVKTGRSTKKYDGQVFRDGYTLVIKNLTKEDLNVSYSCLYGVTLGEKKFLLEEDVFTYTSNTRPNGRTGNNRLSDGEIAGIMVGGIVVVAVIVVILFLLFRRHKYFKCFTKERDKDTVETMSLIEKDYFLEDPLNIECKEGDKATLSCKVRHGSPPVTWLKDNNTIAQSDNTILSTEDSLQAITLQLTLKNTKRSDNGEYCVEVGGFSRKIQLKTIEQDYFLEDPLNIECKEKEEAILSCKVRHGSPPATWLKDNNTIAQSENTIISTKDSLQDVTLQLTLKDTKRSDNGEYCVEVGGFSRKIQLKTIEKPSEGEKSTYMEALNAGREVRQYVRIQVVGKDGVGKTSLVRRLLKQEIADVNTTDGIEINRTCQIRKRDGEWIIGEVETEMEKIGKRILRVLNKNEEIETFNTTNKKRTQFEDDSLLLDEYKNKPLDKNKHLFSNEKIQKPETFNANEISDIKENESVTNNYQNDNKVNVADTSISSADKSKPDTSEIHTPEIIKAMITNMDAILEVVKNKNAKMTSEGLVECGIWDFAGQKDYYVTHQTFCTPHAIYLLVADIKDGTPSIDYKKPVAFDTIGVYTDFWLDSIHCFCEVGPDRSNSVLCPPVIMVCTGIDRVPDEEKEATITKYEKDFLNTYGRQAKGGHKRGKIHFVSNKKEADGDFDSLRKTVSEIAHEMDYFAESDLPTRWIELENALGVLKDLKKNKGKEYCEKFENIVILAKQMFFEKEELISFLNYQHKVGNIIFFKDKCDYVILDPNWLIDCLKCLVCDDKKMEVHCSTGELYDLHNSGTLSEPLIDKLFQKLPKLEFGKYKTHILDVMDKFNIMFKPRNIDSYYMPCLITQSLNLKEIKANLDVENIQCTPWLVLDFKFLPIAYFNHIMYHYIKEKTVCKEKSQQGHDGRPAIYAGKAVVYLDETLSRRLIICFSGNAISLQIWKWNEIDPTKYKTILQELCNKVEELERKFIHKLEYEIKAKCSTGDFCSMSNRLSYKQLLRQCEGGTYWCDEHKTNHNREDLKNTWLKHATAIAKEMKERTKKRAEEEADANQRKQRGQKSMSDEDHDDLPELINQLSKGDEINYKQLMQSSKTEKRYIVRTMIVGKESTGKTCLLRRLLKEDISNDISSDGVDIVTRRCKINIEDGKWIIGKDIDNDIVSRIKRALNLNAEDTDTKNVQDDLMSNVFSKSTDNNPSNLYARCELWDFAGNKDFYATHQVFLTSWAVYLVVADMKDDICKRGLSQCFADVRHIGG